MTSMEETDLSKEMIWRPSARAFLVYYVAIVVAVFGPLINPAVGVPPWLGLVLGLAVLALVAVKKIGQEYRATPRGLKQASWWPAVSEELAWPEVGEMKVQRGLTQTLLNTGDIIIQDTQGVARLCWERLADPKGVKAVLEARQKAFTGGSEREGDSR
jgi:hypothetical protein